MNTSRKDKRVANKVYSFTQELINRSNSFVERVAPLIEAEELKGFTDRIQDIVNYSRGIALTYKPGVAAENQPEPEV